VELRGRCDTTMFFLHLNDVTKRFILVYVTMQEEECDEHNNQNNKIQNRKQPQQNTFNKKSLNQNHYMLNPNSICKALTIYWEYDDI